MGYSVLEFIKKMGIFLICAQCLLHFTAGRSYEKYVKLLIGLMVLAQFAVPVRGLFLGSENAQIQVQVEDFQIRLQETLSDIPSENLWTDGTKEVTAALEEEMKEKLRHTAADFGYQVEEATFSQAADTSQEASPEAPGFDALQLTVTVRKEQDKEKQRLIRVDRIELSSVASAAREVSTQEQGSEASKEDEEILREAFSSCLGTEKEYVQIVYR